MAHHDGLKGPGLELAVAVPPWDCGHNIGQRFAVDRCGRGGGAALGQQRGHQPRVVTTCSHPEHPADPEEVGRQLPGTESGTGAEVPVPAGSRCRRGAAGRAPGPPGPALPPAQDPSPKTVTAEPTTGTNGGGRCVAVVSS